MSTGIKLYIVFSVLAIAWLLGIAALQKREITKLQADVYSEIETVQSLGSVLRGYEELVGRSANALMTCQSNNRSLRKEIENASRSKAH